MVNFNHKGIYGLNDLIEIMTILRGEGGCPWDREQNHKSIRNNMLEEAYEVVEAIDNEDNELLKEELGDVLLQVVFHSQIEKEHGTFDIGDVADGICKKLILRHPHIFGDIKADTTEQVLKNWDEIKKSEKGHADQSQVLASVAKSLPSLTRAQKIQSKAAKVGFDWPDINGALDKVREEIDELLEAKAIDDKNKIEEELGDLLFSAVNLGRFLDVDCEEALYRTCEKFIARFKAMEKAATQTGKNFSDMTLQEMDKLWDGAKNDFKVAP